MSTIRASQPTRFRAHLVVPAARATSWPHLRPVVFVAVCGVALLASVATGAAGELARPSVALAFGATYGPALRVHSGVDVALSAGAPVLSAVGGVVSFVGSVPATGGGYRIGAVSVRCEAGYIVTLSPIEGATVVKGDSVALGQPLGTVGSSGDGSLAEPHIHLSERSNGRYVDPTHLLDNWFTTYTASTSEVGGGGAERTAGPLPAPTARPDSVTAPQVGVVKSVQSQTAAPTAVDVGSPIPLAAHRALLVPPLELTLVREMVSHPTYTVNATLLGARGSAAHSAEPGTRSSAGPRGLHGAIFDRRTVDSFGYLGAGLVVLAAGLGFALHVVGGSGMSHMNHRCGSLFAVRGER